MTTGYNCSSLLLLSIHIYFYIKLLANTFLERDIDRTIVNKVLTLFNRLWSHITQDLKSIFRTSDQSTQRNSDRKSYHSCTRDAHAHRILEDIRT